MSMNDMSGADIADWNAPAGPEDYEAPVDDDEDVVYQRGDRVVTDRGSGGPTGTIYAEGRVTRHNVASDIIYIDVSATGDPKPNIVMRSAERVEPA